MGSQAFAETFVTGVLPLAPFCLLQEVEGQGHEQSAAHTGAYIPICLHCLPPAAGSSWGATEQPLCSCGTCLQYARSWVSPAAGGRGKGG